MQLYLVRHGATVVNEKGLYQGWTDAALTETGKRQCELVKEKLSRVKFDTVISSPLERAVSSAQIIAGIPRNYIITNEALKEINFGAWEGLSFVRQNRNIQQKGGLGVRIGLIADHRRVRISPYFTSGLWLV